MPLASFLISSNLALYILSLSNPTDKDELSNYIPIFHLSFLSKLTESVVNKCFTESANNLLNSSESAYTKFHSTETTILAFHDHIIRAISQQQVTCLCILDLSTAFDAIDHSNLLHSLSSWFGISGIALSWIKSYLTSRSFYVKINDSQSSVCQLFCGVPQALFLVLFCLFCTLLHLALLFLHPGELGLGLESEG